MLGGLKVQKDLQKLWSLAAFIIELLRCLHCVVGASLYYPLYINGKTEEMSSLPSFCNLNRHSSERGRMEDVICQNHTRGLENALSVSELH